MKTRKGCWTCTARKIQCDGALPTCQRCARVGRECQGYEMRLSWPKEGDKRRAMTVSSLPSDVMRPPAWYFINTTWRDMELHRYLSLQMQPLYMVPSSPGPWITAPLPANHMDLIHYFQNCAYLSLVTFATTTTMLRDALLRMALTQDTVSGLALFYALLAFSSLRRSGLQNQAVQLKIAALHSLSASAREGPGLLSFDEAAQHVAASMLLSAFEILLPSESSGEWPLYVWGAMDIIQATHLLEKVHNNDVGQLLNWVFYHDSLSSFTMHHWRHKSLAPYATDSNHLHSQDFQTRASLTRQRPAVQCPNPANAVLNLLSETCNTLLDPRDPESRSQEYQDRIRVLDQRIESLAIVQVPEKSCSSDTSVAKLYQIATRIYLARASQNDWTPSAGLNSLIDDAFAIPNKVTPCVHFFPLFILACEAQTDEQRTTILDLIDRAERDVRVRSMKVLRAGIQSIWVQQDLYADSDLLVNYLGIISSAVSSSNTVPSFA